MADEKILEVLTVKTEFEYKTNTGSTVDDGRRP